MRRVKMTERGALFDYKYHTKAGKEIENLFRDNNLDFNIEIEGKVIDIKQEIAIASTSLDYKTRSVLRAEIIRMASDNVKELLLSGNDDFTLIQASNVCNDMITKYILYGATLSKSKSIYRCISILIINALENLKNPEFNNDIGIDSCALATILYWAKHKGITNKMFIGSQGLLFLNLINTIIPKELTLESYKETICTTNTRYGELYYKLKIGELTNEEFLNRLATNNSTIPTVKNARYSTCADSYLFGFTSNSYKTLEELELDNKSKLILNDLIQNINYYLMQTMLMTQPTVIYGGNAIIFEDDIKRDKESLEIYKQELNETKDKVKEYKLNYNKMKKQYDKLESQNMQLNSLIEAKDKKISTLKLSGGIELEPLKKKVEGFKEEIDTLNNTVLELQRAYNKKEMALNQYKENEKELKSLLATEKMNNIRAKEIMENPSNGELPLSTYINAIKNKRIVIAGGDILHCELSKLGFKNLHLIKASNYNAPTNIIRQADVIVILTGYIAHATTESIKTVIDYHPVPLMYFNNSNIYRLCKDIFSFIYSDEYINAKKHKNRLVKGM